MDSSSNSWARSFAFAALFVAASFLFFPCGGCFLPLYFLLTDHSTLNVQIPSIDQLLTNDDDDSLPQALRILLVAFVMGHIFGGVFEEQTSERILLTPATVFCFGSFSLFAGAIFLGRSFCLAIAIVTLPLSLLVVFGPLLLLLPFFLTFAYSMVFLAAFYVWLDEFWE